MKRKFTLLSNGRLHVEVIRDPPMSREQQRSWRECWVALIEAGECRADACELGKYTGVGYRAAYQRLRTLKREGLV